MKKEKEGNYCPRCYLETGEKIEMQYRPGSTIFFKCQNNHEYDDREALSALMYQAFTAQKQDGQKVIKPPVIEEPDDQDREKGKSLKEKFNEVEGEATPGEGISISPVDFVRISSLVGHFTNSSDLFGAIFALNQRLLDVEEQLVRAQGARKFVSKEDVSKTGKDVAITVIVPERWVTPIDDIAAANGMSMERYMNARVEDGLDNQWFC